MRIISLAIIISILAVMSGCASKQTGETPQVETSDKLDELVTFKGDKFVGWKLASPVAKYDKENIFDYIDGAAELYLAYDFRLVATAEYQDGESSIIIDVYDMTVPENAFGIYSLSRYEGANYVDIGNEGILTDANLDFWKGRYYCKLIAFDVSKKYQDEVVKFGNELASRIKDAGNEPNILSVLPENDIVEKSEKFFTRKLGLDNINFISEENVLNLDGKTKGAVAQYQLDGASLQMFVIEYPSPEKASLAFESYGKYLNENAEPVLADEAEKIRMDKVNGRFTLVKAKDRFLSGFWNIETKELAESALEFISNFEFRLSAGI